MCLGGFLWPLLTAGLLYNNYSFGSGLLSAWGNITIEVELKGTTMTTELGHFNKASKP